MKIQKVELYDLEIIEVDGEFKEARKNFQTVPCVLTNYSLHYGKVNDLLKGSLTDDIINIAVDAYEEQESKGVDITDEEAEKRDHEYGKKFMEMVDEEKVRIAIFLGVVGARPNEEHDYEKFIKRYHGDVEKGMELYFELVMDLVSRDDNKFKKEFEKNTKKSLGKDEKK